MRVADSSLARQALRGIHESRRQLGAVQVQLASGRRFTRASQAPPAAARADTLRNQLETLGRYQASSHTAADRLRAVTATVAVLTELVQDALQLAVAGGSGALTAADRSCLALEAEEIAGAVLDLANSSWMGRHLFGGHLTADPPFARETGAGGYTFAYRGDGGEVIREVGPGRTVTLNLPGDAVFGSPLEAVERLRQALVDNDPQSLAETTSALHQALDQVLQHQAVLGVRTAHLELWADHLGTMNCAYAENLSREEDLDFTKAVSDLHTREIAYQASLAVAARLLQPSLLDYLR